MRKKVLKEILELCEKVGTLDELKEALNNLEYGEDVDGKTVKIRMYKDGNGQVKTEILSICDYRDTENMTIEELEEYYRELEEQYDDMESEEPDDSESEEYEEWEENLEEIEDEMDTVREKIEELKGSSTEE